MAIATLLLSHGVNVNAQDQHGLTPLILACGHGHTAMVSKLVDASANVNICDEHGISALLRASYAGKLDVLQTLVSAGADTNQVHSPAPFNTPWYPHRFQPRWGLGGGGLLRAVMTNGQLQFFPTQVLRKGQSEDW